MAATKGLKGLDKMLTVLNTTKDRTAKRVARAGVQAGLTPLAKAMRSGINGSPASPALKKAARKTIGKSLKRGRNTGGMTVGKAGFSVGKPNKKKRQAAAARSQSGHGVGVSASNVRWFVLGTPKRYQKTTKRYTGILKPFFEGVVKKAAATASPAMLKAAQVKCTQVLARETAKARK